MCTCSGPLGALSSASKTMMEVWVKHINDNGGLGGHPVTLDVQDSKSDPAAATTALKQLIADKVSVIIDGDTFDSVWAKQAGASGIPIIAGNINSDVTYTTPNFYTAGQTNDAIVKSGIDVAAKHAGIKKLGYPYCSETPTCAANIPAMKERTKHDGIEFAYQASISGTQPNYTAQCLAAKQAGVDGLWVGHGASVGARVFEDCAKQDYFPVGVITGTGIGQETFKSDAASKNYWASYGLQPYWADTEPVKRMNEIVDKYAPGFRDTESYTQFPVQFWAVGLLLEHVATNAGIAADSEVTPDVITEGLSKVKDDDLDGFSPKLTFTKGGMNKVECYFVGHIENGKGTVLPDQECVS